MRFDIEQLIETFQTHEFLAPSPGPVLARSRVLARGYRRRRLGLNAAGGLVVAGGLVAGGVAVLPQDGGHSTASSVSSLSGMTPASPSPTPPQSAHRADIRAEALTLFDDDGYGYNNARALAQLWRGTHGIVQIKTRAGTKLLKGGRLPVRPIGRPKSQAARSRDIFDAAGYSYNDAEILATLWHETSIQHVKAEAGQLILDRRALPLAASN
jgi:hypothetical protein